MLPKILVCFHFLLLEYGVYFTFYSKKVSGCILLAAITFAIPLLGRLFQKRFGFLLIGLILEILVLILAGNVVELIIFTFFTVVLAAAYTIQSAAGKDSFLMEISPVWLLFLLCCYIPLYFTGYPGQLPLQMIGVGYVILYLLHLSNKNMSDFKKLHSRMEKLPLVQMGKTYFMSVSSVVLWVLLGMFLGRNERAANFLNQKFYDLIDQLGGSTIKIAPDGMQGSMADFMMESTGESYEQGAQLPEYFYLAGHVMEHIFKIVLLVLAMLLVLCLLYSLYCYLKRERKEDDDMVEFIKKEEEEVFSLYQDQPKEAGKKKSQSPNAMVRKMYKKKIRSGIKSRIPGWASPYELETLAEWQKKGNESMLHMLYEKARYSKEGCLKEDLDRYMSTEENYRQ